MGRMTNLCTVRLIFQDMLNVRHKPISRSRGLSICPVLRSLAPLLLTSGPSHQILGNRGGSDRKLAFIFPLTASSVQPSLIPPMKSTPSGHFPHRSRAPGEQALDLRSPSLPQQHQTLCPQGSKAERAHKSTGQKNPATQGLDLLWQRGMRTSAKN